MSHTMKLVIRTLLTLGLMIVAAYLIPKLSTPIDGGKHAFLLSNLPQYLVYLALGLTTGSMVGPRFSKGRNPYGYLFPLLVFLLIALAPVLYLYLSFLPVPAIGQFLLSFTNLAWCFVGLFVSLLFR